MSRVVKLEELCLPDQIGKYGIPAVAEEFSEDKVRYLRITDIDDYGNLLENDKKSVSSPEIEKYILKEGDIVFARTGNSTGRTYFHEEKNGELAFAGFLIKFSLDKSKVNPKYLKYFTISKPYKQWVDNLSNGSTRGNINAKTFADCPIILPSREQQDYLVRVLSSLEDKIQINNQINQELEAMAKTLYDYWFVQFDFPDQNGKPYKSSGGKMVYHPELKREIPEGWGVEKLGELIELERGVTYAKSDIVEKTTNDAIGVLRATNITGNVMDLNDLVYLTKDKINNKQILKQNETLIVMSSGSKEHLGKNAINYYEEVIGFGAFCSKIVPKKYSTYINTFLQSSEFKGYLLKQSMGTNINNLTNSDILDCRIILPNEEILDKFENMVEKNFKLISNNYIQNQQLTQLRDWLLPMLMNGQVKVE